MGEYEKLVGEFGEKTAGAFLDLIGWRPRKDNFDIRCGDRSHKNQTHGIDSYYNYRSPLVDDVLDHVVISVKYSALGYPNNPTTKFKEYYFDLAAKISCFEMSPERARANKGALGVKKSKTFGLLIWLHGNPDAKQDVVADLANVRFRDELPAHVRPIYVLDNVQLRFVVDCINYVQKAFASYSSSFAYHNTGSNVSAVSRTTDGSFLPIQLLLAGVIIFRLEGLHRQDIRACVCTAEPFSEESLEKLVGLAQDMTSNYAAETIISFKDFRPERHQATVSDVLMSFSNRDFANSVSVQSYKTLVS